MLSKCGLGKQELEDRAERHLEDYWRLCCIEPKGKRPLRPKNSDFRPLRFIQTINRFKQNHDSSNMTEGNKRRSVCSKCFQILFITGINRGLFVIYIVGPILTLEVMPSTARIWGSKAKRQPWTWSSHMLSSTRKVGRLWVWTIIWFPSAFHQVCTLTQRAGSSKANDRVLNVRGLHKAPSQPGSQGWFTLVPTLVFWICQHLPRRYTLCHFHKGSLDGDWSPLGPWCHGHVSINHGSRRLKEVRPHLEKSSARLNPSYETSKSWRIMLPWTTWVSFREDFVSFLFKHNDARTQDSLSFLC